ncbi:hypothetical protein ACNVED_16030 (plasmid) [Legionella sp. D16C41]|uniref:hypothetical protein n=1 Tax=Legionella sp. D16C41 TaxID=3402688 RepID=UPI003AF49783
MFSKGFFSSSPFSWDKDLSIRDNIINVIQGYLPYQFNILTKKTHLSEAKDLIYYLETYPDITDCEAYLRLQAMRQELDNESGEFKKRLNFCVQKMEEQNPLLKTLGSTGQAIKSLFGMNS